MKDNQPVTESIHNISYYLICYLQTILTLDQIMLAPVKCSTTDTIYSFLLYNLKSGHLPYKELVNFIRDIISGKKPIDINNEVNFLYVRPDDIDLYLKEDETTTIGLDLEFEELIKEELPKLKTLGEALQWFLNKLEV